jgi:hypothetical protein
MTIGLSHSWEFTPIDRVKAHREKHNYNKTNKFAKIINI